MYSNDSCHGNAFWSKQTVNFKSDTHFGKKSFVSFLFRDNYVNLSC